MSTAEKVDFKKSLDSYQARAGEFRTLELSPLRYLMIDGHGDPNTSQLYADALTTLYPVAYAIKFDSKRELGRDYVVPPLEGLWWAEDHAVFTTARDKNAWNWTMMLLAPEWITLGMFESALAAVSAKGAAPLLTEVRFETLAEGLCVQTLHIGSYDDEAPVLAHLHEEVIPAAGLGLTGRHHEIYLSDPRRVAPEKLRTILRQPVLRVQE